jgi:hypothetical protein
MKIQSRFLLFTLLFCIMGCKPEEQKVPYQDIAYEAFIYAYPMMEQVKTVNGMMTAIGIEPNKVIMNPGYPFENVGQPIVAMNLTSMTGGLFIDVSGGPVTIEVPEVKDRYIVYQCVDVFTHNFYYIGTRANYGEAGKFIFYNKDQNITDTEATPVLLEGDHAMIVVRIDIKDETELELVRGIQEQIKIIDAPETSRSYPIYDKDKAFSSEFVFYLNELLKEVPMAEIELFERFKSIGVMNEVVLSDEAKQQVQKGIDSAYAAIKAELKNLEIGNGWVGATELFGTREFLNANYMARAVGADFGLWGNSKEEANYFLLMTEGEGMLRFEAYELPPLTDMGFWSVTMYDENVFASKNEYDSYLLTMDTMQFEEDGSLIIKCSKTPEEGNWLYTPTEKFGLMIRAYQANPERIGTYVPPAFIQN